MSSLTLHRIYVPHAPHLDLHWVATAVQALQTRAKDLFAVEAKHECKRYRFLEDSLMAREMRRL
ncbi:hypothetical protein [Mycobacterium sp. C31M]